MSERPYTPEWIDKADVACRQIAAAIRMFFERADPVVAHSVISAGHQVLTDLCRAKEIPILLRRAKPSGEQRSQINFASNFFKHADRDVTARINIEPLASLNAEFLMDAAYMLLSLKQEQAPIEVKIYASWFVSKHPDLFENVMPDVIPRFAEFDLDVDDFAQIAMLLAFAVVSDLDTNGL